MLDDLQFSLLGALTPGALLGLCIFFILTGKLVPIRTHDRELQVRDQQIAYLQAALDACRAVDEHRAGQVSELMEHSRITTEIIRSLPAGLDGESIR